MAWFECLPLPKLMTPKSKGWANETENRSVWECAERMFPFIATVEGLSQSYNKDESAVYCFYCFFIHIVSLAFLCLLCRFDMRRQGITAWEQYPEEGLCNSCGFQWGFIGVCKSCYAAGSGQMILALTMIIFAE